MKQFQEKWNNYQIYKQEKRKIEIYINKFMAYNINYNYIFILILQIYKFCFFT